MTKFRDLNIGQTFDWIDDDRRNEASFFMPCVKISARKYRTTDGEPVMHYTVGSINAKVHHVGEYK